MAFIFTVEDGTGLVSGANSYVSVEDADDILVTNIHASYWSALTTPNKEHLLAWATRYLDERTRWKGIKTVDASPLRWPRTGVYDRDNILIGTTVIPQQLKIATAEMARYLVDEDRTIERDQDALSRLRADTVELEFIEGYRISAVPSNLSYLLMGLGYIGSGSLRFAPVIR